MSFERYCINESSTILETISAIDESKDRCVLALNDKKRIIGVISQGDILRAICNGINIYSQVSKIVKSQFIYLKEKDMVKAYNIFREKKLTLIPIINDDYTIKDIICLEDIFEYLENR